MVKSRPVRSDPALEDSSSSSESFTNLIPRSISFVAWTQLPPPRANPLDATSRKWMTDRQPAIWPFCSPPSSGDDFFKDSLVTPSIHREEALLFHEVPSTATHIVGPSLLHSHLIRGEFPWVPYTFVARATITVQRWSHSTHTFFAVWGEFTPTVEDVHVLLKLPLFGDYDISASPVDSHIIDKAKELKTATFDSARYSREFLTRLRSKPPPASADVKTPSRKIRGTGVRLPLASLFLGSFYGCLDQIQEQLAISFGLFPTNSFVDLVFLQHFLFERFPEYAPVRKVPEPPPEGEERVLNQGYGAGLWVVLAILYWTYEFMTHNIRSSRSEGVYDIWALILHPQMLLGFIITDTISTVGGAFWPFAYLLDRVCRQFGLDQPLCCIGIGFQDVHEAMKVVLFKPNASLPSFDANNFIPPNRAGRVLDTWVAYYARLKNSVKRYEGQDSMQHFTNVQVMCKDPYFAITTFKSPSKQVLAQEPSGAKGKKRKLPSFQRGKKAVSKQSSTRSAKVKKEILLPTRAFECLKAHHIKKFYPLSSFSSPIVIQASTTEEFAYGDDEVVQESPTSPIHESASPNSSAGKVVTDERVDPTNSDHSSSPTNNVVKASQGLDKASEEVDSKTQSHICLVTTEADIVETEQIVHSQALVVALPLSPFHSAYALAVKVVPLLSSIFSKEDAYLLSVFAVNHDGFLLPESAFPIAFLKPSYTFFTDFLPFTRAHPFMELLCTHKDKVMEDLKALGCFGFKGAWLDELSHQFSRSIPATTFEDLHQVVDAMCLQEQHNASLKHQIECLSTELTLGEAELARLDAKRKEIEEARSGLNVDFHI
ncbi:hypothetical protein SESBI_32026 [Sesbania bispinosa]|nr:hypothetical protein SESBI_32026 [Sesbania bispinosa]